MGGRRRRRRQHVLFPRFEYKFLERIVVGFVLRLGLARDPTRRLGRRRTRYLAVTVFAADFFRGLALEKEVLDHKVQDQYQERHQDDILDPGSVHGDS
jgi:hypothetical protein